ncbi:DUF1800 domain-containing protein [Psychromonas ossibalaenae]|uniref:DUF1800 domain-containing protein n=1 Tax=Psychromonas ossibalaenae TaxID=444922 RepID=UPI00036DE503|nr:DUF1800 domain-containing protein [Psychromonas ossibalaenae]
MKNDANEQRAQYAKFLYRATFGPKKGEIDNLQKIGIETWFEQQTAAPPSYHLPKAQEFAALSDESVNDNMRTGAWWQRTIQADDQLRQRMAYTLSQIFVVSKHGVGNRHAELANYYDILVKHAFGNFRDLLEEITLSSVMGKYLTLEGSQKTNTDKNTFPDENFAREIMQLFSLGLWELQPNGWPKLDAQGNKIPTYSQNDVEELARAFTGWRSNDLFAPMYADNGRHDNEAKEILGTSFPAGQSAEQDMQQALDLLFNHDNTPAFIATLLIKRFVTSNPRRQYILRVADVFRSNADGIRGDLQAVLTAVLTDSDVLNGFAESGDLQRKNTFGRVHEPIIAVANLARAFAMESSGPRWWDYQYTEAHLGQSPLTSPSVFNFYTPDFTPQGELAENNLTSPEFYILTADNMRRIHNRLWANIYAAWAQPNEKSWIWDAAEFEALQAFPEQYIALINERLFGGLISQGLAEYLNYMLTVELQGAYAHLRVRNTLYVAVTSPEFFSPE